MPYLRIFGIKFEKTIETNTRELVNMQSLMKRERTLRFGP